MEEVNLSVEEKRFPEWMERKERIHNVGRLPAISVYLGFMAMQLDKFPGLILRLSVKGLITSIILTFLYHLNKKFAPTFRLGCVRLGAEYVYIIVKSGRKSNSFEVLVKYYSVMLVSLYGRTTFSPNRW